MSLEQGQDSAIVQEVLSGKHDAFEVLVARYFETVRMVALAKTRNVADAEDVAQETFLKAYTTLGKLRDREKLAHWLVRIARNLAVSVVRRRVREGKRAESWSAEPVMTPDHGQREFYAAVATQVEALPVKLREVMLLHYFEGLKCREIALRLNLSTNAVVKRLVRGRAVLGDRLLQEWGGEAQQKKPRARTTQVMGAIAAIPLPDWEAQLAGQALPAGQAVHQVWALGKLALAKAGPMELAVGLLALLLGGFYLAHHVRGTNAPGTTRPVESHVEAEIGVASSPKEGPLARLLYPVDEEPGHIPITAPLRTEVGFVSGTVYDQDGTPLPEVRVWAISSGRRANGNGTTDARGAFYVKLTAQTEAIEEEGVPKFVDISCSKAGYVHTRLSGVRRGATDVQIVLMRPATLSGFVVDGETGSPIEEFSLRIEGPTKNPYTGEHFNKRWKEFRSATGTFTIKGDYGIEALAVIADGYAGTIVESRLSEGGAEEGVVIVLERGSRVAGFVLDEQTGAAISEARVVLRFDDKFPRSNYGEKTDAFGAFVFRDLLPFDRVGLDVRAKGYARKVVRDLETGTGEPVSIYLGRGGSVRGRVVYGGGPPPGSQEERIEDGYCTVRLSDADRGGSHGLGDLVQPDGSYEAKGLAAGLYLANAFFWVDGGARQQFSASKIVQVRDGETSIVNIDFAVQGGEVKVFVEGVHDPEAWARNFDVFRVTLHSLADTSTALQRFAPQNWKSRSFTSYGTLEAGRYLLRGKLLKAGRVMEQEIQINSGKTTEVYIDFGELDGEPDEDGAEEE